MTRYLPICLDVAGRPALVVGGGSVGTERALDLVERGARVRVISPAVSEALQAAAAAGRLALEQRRFRAGDTEGAFLVVVATDDPETNAAAYREANGRGQLVNVCDDPPNCNFIFASKIERGPLTVSIFSHATSPAFSRRVRRELEAWLGPEYGELAELLAELRPRVMAMEGLTQPDRQRIFERVVYSEALLLLREGRADAARALVERLVNEELRAIQQAGGGSAQGA